MSIHVGASDLAMSLYEQQKYAETEQIVEHVKSGSISLEPREASRDVEMWTAHPQADPLAFAQCLESAPRKPTKGQERAAASPLFSDGAAGGGSEHEGGGGRVAGEMLERRKQASSTHGSSNLKEDGA